MVRADPRRRESAARHLDGRAVVAQEGVGVAGRVDAPAELDLGLAPRLADTNAVAALGNDPVHDRRGPRPAFHLADDRRVREAEHRHQRVGLVRVTASFVDPQRTDQEAEVVERRDALPTDGSVRGAAGHNEAEGDGTGVGHDDLKAGRLGDDREVAGHAGPDRGKHPLPTILLGGHAGDQDLAVESIGETCGHDRSHRSQDRRDPALHVAGTPTVDAAVANFGGPWVDRPRSWVAGRDHVDVADQEDPSPAGPPEAANDDRQALACHLGPWPVRIIAGKSRRIRFETLRRQPGIAGEPLDLVLDRGLGARDRRDPNEPSEVLFDALGVDCELVSHARSDASCRSGRPCR